VILNRGMKVAEGTPEELERISDTHGLEDVFLQLIRSEAQP
jgi:ABC-type Na+ transport system ATPase subunit NatA